MSTRYFEEAKQMDKTDPLATFKEKFYTEPETLYFDGNSLGLLSKSAEQVVLDIINQWKHLGIEGWTNGKHPWFYFSEKLGEMTMPLVGAKKEEIIVTGSITTNLHQLMATFYKPEGKRVKILADSLTFPSDIYALKSQIRLHGLAPEDTLIRVPSEDGRTLDEDKIIEAMGDDVAVAMLPTVLYRSGQILDVHKLTKAAHERGILIGFDLAHSIGIMPHDLHDAGVDFAVWCNYKYLNAGPGSVGGLYVHERHFGTAPGLAGWFGSKKDKQFDMDHEMSPADTAAAYQIGTPHMLSAAPLLGSLEIFQEAGIDAIRKKSLKLTSYLMTLIEEQLDGHGFTIANPREAHRRGGHVSLEHKEAARICKALKAAGVIPDFRKPNGIRLAPIPLYTSFEDVWNMVDRLKTIMETEAYKQYSNERDVVA